EVAILRLAESMVDNAARAFGKREYCAHPFNIGGKTAVEGKGSLADQLGGFRHGLVERYLLAADLRRRLRQLALETGDRSRTAVLEHLKPLVGPLDDEIVVERPIKGIGNVLEQLRCSAPGLGLARGRIRHAG